MEATLLTATDPVKMWLSRSPGGRVDARLDLLAEHGLARLDLGRDENTDLGDSTS